MGVNIDQYGMSSLVPPPLYGSGSTSSCRSGGALNRRNPDKPRTARSGNGATLGAGCPNRRNPPVAGLGAWTGA
jgi:hypothetical protein